MTASLSPIVKQQFFDDSGYPLASGKVFTYIAGTNTPVATYKTAAGIDENSNPIILDARGECDIWLSSTVAYKFKLVDSDNVEIWTVDNITSTGTGSGGTVDWSSIANRPTTFPPSPHNQNWSTITSTPTTIGGYGITDVYTKTEVNIITSELQNQISDNASDINDLTGRVENLETSVSAINSEITNLQNTDISLQTQIDGNTSAISQLQTDLNDVYDDINVINADVNTLSGNVTSLLASQYKVKVTSADSSPDYLLNKITSVNETLTITDGDDSVELDYDGRIPADSGDTITSAWGTLYDKLLPGSNMTMDLVTCAGIRKVQFNAITSGIDPVVSDHKVMASLMDPSYGTLEEKLIDFEGNSFGIVTCGGTQKVQITSDSYKTKVTSATEAGFLDDILDVSNGISKTIDGNKIVLIAEGSTKVRINSADTNPGYLADKIKGSDNITISTSANQVLIVSATGFNITTSGNVTHTKTGDVSNIFTTPNLSATYVTLNGGIDALSPVGSIEYDPTSDKYWITTNT